MHAYIHTYKYFFTPFIYSKVAVGLEMEKQVLEKECNVCQVSIIMTFPTIHTFIPTFTNIPAIVGGLYERGESLSLPPKSHFHHQDKATTVPLEHLLPML